MLGTEEGGDQVSLKRRRPSPEFMTTAKVKEKKRLLRRKKGFLSSSRRVDHHLHSSTRLPKKRGEARVTLLCRAREKERRGG